MVKQGIEKKDFQPLSKYKTTHDRLKNHGESALNDIFELFHHIIEEKENKDEILAPLEVTRKNSTEINITYLSIPIFIRLLINFDKETGYIEWGIRNKENDIVNYRTIHRDEYDKNGSINEGFTDVKYAHVLIPEAFIKIFDTIKNEDILL